MSTRTWMSSSPTPRSSLMGLVLVALGKSWSGTFTSLYFCLFLPSLAFNTVLARFLVIQLCLIGCLLAWLCSSCSIHVLLLLLHLFWAAHVMSCTPIEICSLVQREYETLCHFSSLLPVEVFIYFSFSSWRGRKYMLSLLQHHLCSISPHTCHNLHLFQHIQLDSSMTITHM